MFESMSELWVSVLLIAIILSIIARWAYYKFTGKEISPGDSDIMLQLRFKLVKVILENKQLQVIEMTDGRAAVRKEIGRQIQEFIDSSSLLTESEKELIESFALDDIIKIVENELVKRGVLKPEK